jgi:HAD superfamily hydrolase (TIGR01549 family)
MEKLITIFDFDGTMADTTEVVTRSFEYLFQKYNLPNFGPNWIASKSGIALEDIVQGLVEENNLAQDNYTKMLQEFRDYQLTFFYEEVELFPDVKPLLESLKQKDSIICLFSNRSERFFEEYFRRQNILEFFDLILGRESVKEAKPSPEGVELIKQKYPNRKNITLIGDTPIDILTAKNSEIISIAVATGKHSHGELAIHNPDVLVYNLRELL